MLFRVNPSDSAPIYRQIVRQVRDAVASGKLRRGDKLPSHRELARELVINHLTVKQAYDALEGEGLIRTERGVGTFAARDGSGNLRAAGLTDLRVAVRELVVHARLLGVPRAELLRLVREAWSPEPASAGRER
ncbi:MAG: GntR family transcriptional regulator [Planctomycetes bacterium]|nr:GntR family transcriptional regulator [Planctomycetota bacterium]